ncbi:MAG: hypothetical protein HZA50_17550 [Planctomycetes bacterium]|nr:hypothetical protein [Planctomycetota bacterium]
MGQILFWLEAAVMSVLFVALGLGILSRVHRRGLRWLVRIVWGILAFLPWLVTIGAFAAVEIWVGGAMAPLISSSLAFAAFIAASIVVIRRARRPSAIDNIRIAATWRLNRLALAWVAAILLTCTTFWNLDLAVRQEIAALRVEAGAIASSLAPPRIPESQNAAVLYRQAWDILDARKDTPEKKWSVVVVKWLEPTKGEFKPDDEQMLDFLRKQGPVIDLLHKAAELPGCNFEIQYNPYPVGLVLPQLGNMRSLSRLLCLSSRVAAHQGRMVDAMKDLNAAMALAGHCSAEPTLMASMVSCGIEDMAFGTFQYVLDQGALTDDSINAMRLHSSLSFNAALRRSMRMEMAFGLSYFTMIEPSAAFTEASIPVAVAAPDFMGDFLTRTVAVPYRVFLWGNDAAAYLQCMRRCERLSVQPYYKSVQEWQMLQEPESKGMLTKMIVPSFTHPAENAARADARHRLMQLGVAMWRYRLAEGAFPDDLGRLVPKYLPAIPVDPFSDGSLKLARTDGKFIIYSLGPDLADDGGMPYDKKSEKGDISLILGKARP